MSGTSVAATRHGAVFEGWLPGLLSALQIVAALLFLEHGMQKLFGLPGPFPDGSPALFSLIWFAAVLEFAGGLLLLADLFIRTMAVVLSGEMALAYWIAHAPRSPFPVLNGGDAPILFCFVFLFSAAAGSGAWGLGALRARQHASRPG